MSEGVSEGVGCDVSVARARGNVACGVRVVRR